MASRVPVVVALHYFLEDVEVGTSRDNTRIIDDKINALRVILLENCGKISDTFRFQDIQGGLEIRLLLDRHLQPILSFPGQRVVGNVFGGASLSGLVRSLVVRYIRNGPLL